MRKNLLMALALLLLLCSPLKASLRNPPPAPGRVQLESLFKFMYTYRERDESTGVEGVSEAALRWAGLSVEGLVSDDISFRLELAGGSGIYSDPIYQNATPVLSSGPFELGQIGVRRAEVLMRFKSPHTDAQPAARVRLGTFMPGWAFYQDRSAAEWDFIDLPLMYRHESLHALGWQNAGIAVDLYPFSWFQETPSEMEVVITVFAINGYFPRSFANEQPALVQGERESNLGAGGRLALRSPRWLVYGGFYEEGFREDLYGEKDPESYRARAWIAGARYSDGRYWLLAEWSALSREDYQLKIDGDRADKESMSSHVGAGFRVTERLELTARWDWLDPNTLDQSGTMEPSKNDQTTAWTCGVNWHLTSSVELMLNYVLLVEQGKRVDVDAGRTDGPYRDRDNNYLRAQLQVRL
ncbi:MAG: porin [bacterium]